jgi:DNA-binding NtrC family response regulator
LRRRKEDIPILAEHFLDRYCRRFAKPPARLTPQILEVLTAYDWPGNVREFENCVEYMINLHAGGPLSLGLVPPDIREAVRAAGTAGAAEASRGPAPRPEPLPALLAGDEIIPLERLELEAILRAIERCGDTAEGKRQAARALGVSLATLYRRLKAIGR